MSLRHYDDQLKPSYIAASVSKDWTPGSRVANLTSTNLMLHMLQLRNTLTTRFTPKSSDTKLDKVRTKVGEHLPTHILKTLLGF